MTGEITLRGRVLPIGGLKEKLLAAKIGDIKTVLIPKGNVPDLKKMPKEITKGMKIIPVEHADQVLRLALELADPTSSSSQGHRRSSGQRAPPGRARPRREDAGYG